LAVPRYRGELTSHYDGERFSNLTPFDVPGLGSVLRWKFTTRHEKWPERVDFPKAPAPPARVNDATRITFINHATVLIQLAELNILTDPVFAEHIGPFPRFGAKRHKAPGVPFERLPKIDVVLLSHNHYDHLDVPSLRRLVARDAPTILAGLGNRAFFEKEKIQGCVELDLWENHQRENVTFSFTPAQHWSSRSISDRFRSLWGGFYVHSDKTTVFFAGDTGWGPHFTTISSKLGAPDIALLPIGAYEPRWFMRAQHMDPAEAVMAHLTLRAKVSIATHFGCFDLASEGMFAPQEALKIAMSAQQLQNDQFLVLEHGESFLWPN
jgi:L-ascorbate metabolism protein UlaG (beta-lactamase superfamily)